MELVQLAYIDRGYTLWPLLLLRGILPAKIWLKRMGNWALVLVFCVLILAFGISPAKGTRQ